MQTSLSSFESKTKDANTGTTIPNDFGYTEYYLTMLLSLLGAQLHNPLLILANDLVLNQVVLVMV